MKNLPLFALAIMALVVAGFAFEFKFGKAPVVVSPHPAQNTPARANPTLAFAPGFDDMMTMLVQPRHLKLYYAGVHKNWELAAAEMRDLRSSFGRIAQTIPTYQGNDVNASVKSLIEPQMKAMDDAIDAADPDKFVAAYGELTNACNSCHTYMEHPFIFIKIPDSPNDAAHPDQEYGPVP
jgi:hypothetical protein